MVHFLKRKHKCIIHICLPPGEESGGFSFTVTDGQHTTPLSQFVVTARPLTITMVAQEELVVFPGNTHTHILQTLLHLHMVTGAFSSSSVKKVVFHVNNRKGY